MNIATVRSNEPTKLKNGSFKKIDDDGFVFYTNYNSRKGKRCRSKKVALNFGGEN